MQLRIDELIPQWERQLADLAAGFRYVTVEGPMPSYPPRRFETVYPKACYL